MWHSILNANRRFRCGGMILSCLFFVGVFDIGTVSASCGDYLHAPNSMNSGHTQATDVATAPPLIPRNSPICSGPNCDGRNSIPAIPTEHTLMPSNHDMVLTECLRQPDHNGSSVSMESPAEPLLLSGMRGRVYRPPRIDQF